MHLKSPINSIFFMITVLVNKPYDVKSFSQGCLIFILLFLWLFVSDSHVASIRMV